MGRFPAPCWFEGFPGDANCSPDEEPLGLVCDSDEKEGIGNSLISLVSLLKCYHKTTRMMDELFRLLCPWDSPGKNTGVGCHALLQRIFPTQGSNPGLLHCRQILSHMSCKEVPPTFEVDAKTYPRTESPGSAGQETSISGLLSSRSRKSRGTRGQQKPRIKPGHEATSPRLADRPSGFVSKFPSHQEEIRFSLQRSNRSHSNIT
ncbi:uncharacterized protein LOC129645509 [Bubalus kerabau]|uniref:uncharacterized protein LOC129645509 n=1 Tax=Bubalus carabanensis TaxID=3119969 RepID=UPI00244ED42C|nr:uncharacterized protein LOC129645509 [Bubalus carabanensis]